MFIEQAYKGDNTWWKVWFTALAASGIFIINFIVILFMSPQQMDDVYNIMRDIPNNIGLAINLIPFAFLLGLLFLFVYLLHKRSIVTLTTARKKVDFKRIFFSFRLIVSLSVIAFLISYFVDDTNIVWNFKPVEFSILVVVSLLLFPFQIGFEEYLFRGFLLQQIGIAVRNRWFPLIVTSIFFGLCHSANPEVAEMGFGVMAFYIGTGLLLGIMTLMDDGLELSLGFHLGNNLIAALLITSDYSALQTDAVFKYTGRENTGDVLQEMIITMLITYPVLLTILAQRYKWTGWKEKLTGKINKINHDELRNFNKDPDVPERS